MCDAAQIPRMFVVNKMDRENANFAKNVADIQASFGRKCIPFQVPVGEANEFKGLLASSILQVIFPKKSSRTSNQHGSA
ncbi:MAG: hypothetical protein CM1200mP22_19490 [Dehalococcoidia bacterium]|nr:MAG: hypothetical protein CM1200mP22_19490 [Dehalococcoidia bacterium]